MSRKGFCKEFCKILWEKNTWNIRHLVDKTFVPSAQRTSVLYSRLTDFKMQERITKALSMHCAHVKTKSLLFSNTFLDTKSKL